MADFGWGLVGPGRIARRFADAVRQLPGTRLVAVHGRDEGRAQAFAETWREATQPPARAAPTLASMLEDEAVHGVYIATPHAFHADAIRQCLLAGKAVLCEKPMVVNERMAAELVALARERGVFLMEALWTRFLPVYANVGEWLRQGAIGQLRSVQSSFAFNSPMDPHSRLFDPAQGGGALLDIGIYNLAMTQWALHAATGHNPALESLDVSGVLGPTGVDHRLDATLRFAGGAVSQMHCAIDGFADNSLRIFGDQGYIIVAGNFWEPTMASLHRPDTPAISIDGPFRINGFEGQIEEAIRCARLGLVESPVMPHADTLALVGWMDRMRATLGVRYPFE